MGTVSVNTDQVDQIVQDVDRESPNSFDDEQDWPARVDALLVEDALEPQESFFLEYLVTQLRLSQYLCEVGLLFKELPAIVSLFQILPFLDLLAPRPHDEVLLYLLWY